MYTNNPYAQAGWSTSQGQQPGGFSPVPPSIFGALPSAPATSNTGFLTFYFTSFNPNVLNSVIVGPSRNYIDVVTNANSGTETTVFTNSQGQVLATITWSGSPYVEVNGAVSRRLTSQFIGLSPDRSYRAMEFKGKRYAWIPNPANNSISLYNVSYNPAELVARVLRATDSVNLQITTNAIHEGLMETCLVSTVLFLCGRNID